MVQVRPGLYLSFGPIRPITSVALLPKRFSYLNFLFSDLRLPFTSQFSNMCHFFLSKCDQSVITFFLTFQKLRINRDLGCLILLEDKVSKRAPSTTRPPLQLIFPMIYHNFSSNLIYKNIKVFLKICYKLIFFCVII